MWDPQIVFQGIECPKMKAQVKTLVEDLAQFCPSDACVKATFRKIHDRFWADIKIASESAYMHAMDQANGMTDVLENLKSNLMGQIVDWRNHRFAV